MSDDVFLIETENGGRVEIHRGGKVIIVMKSGVFTGQTSGELDMEELYQWADEYR